MGGHIIRYAINNQNCRVGKRYLAVMEKKCENTELCEPEALFDRVEQCKNCKKTSI